MTDLDRTYAHVARTLAMHGLTAEAFATQLASPLSR